jgi:hypothetical protein
VTTKDHALIVSFCDVLLGAVVGDKDGFNPISAMAPAPILFQDVDCVGWLSAIDERPPSASRIAMNLLTLGLGVSVLLCFAEPPA